jgi:hypothetical protein
MSIAGYPDLLWTPNNGNAPANELRTKAFAASALAAHRGYASTRNVKTPEKTRTVLFAHCQYRDIYDRTLNEPAAKKAGASNWYKPMRRRINRQRKPE